MSNQRAGASGWNEASGLYDPAFEHDACGVGFVATMSGAASHAVVKHALTVLARMRHRGAAGADPLTGDGSGILLQIPHDFFARHPRNRTRKENRGRREMF